MDRTLQFVNLGSLLESQMPVRIWAEWDDRVPGFVEIDLIGHGGPTNRRECCFTLTVTVNRSMRKKAAKWVLRPSDRSPGVPLPDHRHRFMLHETPCKRPIIRVMPPAAHRPVNRALDVATLHPLRLSQHASK